jgi:putative DNA primase/helicase
MTAAIRKFVVMEVGCPEAVALWTLHTHVLDAFQISPRLAITSPEKRCGKTTALDVVYSLAPRPLSTSNTSAAAIFRTIEAARPTLLIDEADTFLTSSEEIRGC